MFSFDIVEGYKNKSISEDQETSSQKISSYDTMLPAKLTISSSWKPYLSKSNFSSSNATNSAFLA